MFSCSDKSKLNCYEMKTYADKIQWKFWVKLFFIQIQFSPFPLTDTDKVFGCSQGGQEQPPNKCQLLVLCDICTASLKRPPGRKKREQIVRVPHCIHTVSTLYPHCSINSSLAMTFTPPVRRGLFVRTARKFVLRAT